MPIIDKNQGYFNVSPKTARRQKMGEMLIENASKSEPVYGWGQALSKLLAAGAGAYSVKKADDSENEAASTFADAASRAAPQWKNPDTGEHVGANYKQNLAQLLQESGNEDLASAASKYALEGGQNIEDRRNEVEDATIKASVLPKEIRILQYLQGMNNPTPAPAPEPQPSTNPAPQANTAPPAKAPLTPAQIQYATQPPTVGPDGEQNLAFPNFGLLPEIDGKQPAPRNSANNIPGTGGLLQFSNKPSVENAPPIDQPPVMQPNQQAVGGPETQRDMTNPANLYMDKILGIKPADRISMEKKDKQGALQALGIQETQGKINQALTQLSASDFNTGTIGGLTENTPGSPAYKLAATIASVKANLGFDRLQAMRDASPTGGALGQVSDTENKLLQSAVANLDLAQGGEQLKAALLEVQKHYNNVSKLIAQGQGQEYQTPQSAAPQKPISEMSDQELEAIANGG